MKLELLVNHPYLIPEIAQLKFNEFSQFTPNDTVQDYIKRMETHLASGEMPTYVVIENKQLVGTVCLRKCDMSTHPHLTPWLASLVVHPNYRRQGIGAFLVEEIERRAKEMGYPKLYLFTTYKAAWYAKLGWQVFEKTTFKSFPVTVMEKALE